MLMLYYIERETVNENVYVFNRTRDSLVVLWVSTQFIFFSLFYFIFLLFFFSFSSFLLSCIIHNRKKFCAVTVTCDEICRSQQ